MNNIHIVQGDITLATTDAIVNAANPIMLGGGGVDGAIHAKAGPRLLEACRKVKSVNGIRCPFGESRITEAADLAAKYVIHSVGPIYRNEAEPAKILSSAYRSALLLAVEHQCKSIAFPAISCGAYGYPLKDAAFIALRVCAEPEFAGLEMWFYLYDRGVLAVFEEALLVLRGGV